ncbi:MAG TPA: hypothetical protein VF116_07435 [Ktedonobacterales bacterium]
MSSPGDSTRVPTSDAEPVSPAEPVVPGSSEVPSAANGTGGTGSPRDAAYWAAQGTRLRVGAAPRNQVNNVDGRNAVGPLQGFGKMWQKTYRVRLAGAAATPPEVIRVWKQEFPSFWPRGNRFYVPLTGIAPGEVAMLTVRAGGMPLSTGVLVLYADDESFTLMTPQGHMFAGWITFSAYEDAPRTADAGQPKGEVTSTVAQAQVQMRANDPLYELGLRMGGHKQEDKFWAQTLRAVAARFGVANALVQTEVVCLDPRLRWSYARNITKNAAVRTVLLGPTRWFRRAQ